ncbi:cytochrome P450 [Russula emetica]|nr:cytochrome P450 [Russula emetica]
MAHGVPPRVNALKKCMGWFPGANSATAYAPAVLWDGVPAAREGVAPLVTLSSPLKGILFCLLVTFVVSYARSSRKMLPPHPRRLPIIGNLFKLADKRWLSSRDCKERFGEVMYLDVVGKPTIVFNSMKSAFEFLERRASNSSGRPRLIVANEIINSGLALALMDHGDLWRRMRRAAQEALTKTAVQRYRPILTRQATILASALLNKPENRDQHFQRSVASTIVSILYNIPSLTSKQDNAVQDISRAVNSSLRAVVGTSLVEFFPWMVYVPQRFANWKREALKQSAERTERFLRLFNHVKADIASVGVRPSFSASLIEQRDRYHLSEREMAFLAGHMYGAGLDTTSGTLMWWALAMVAFPEVQHRAQAEIDVVVGRARLPSFADAARLPYVRAVIKEVLRWRPAVERGLPHKAADDDWYEGMFIPKGATCMANIWHCNHDRAIFGDDADDFRPERHLDAKGEEVLPGPRETNGEGHVTFGFGRRICVGKYLANDSLFINTATILWAAKLVCARDENGKEVPPDPNAFVDNGITTHPAPHGCMITPRFPEVLSILADEKGNLED